MVSNLSEAKYQDVTLGKANDVEAEINAMRDELRDYDLTNIGKPEYDAQSSRLFNNLFSLQEKIGRPYNECQSGYCRRDFRRR